MKAGKQITQFRLPPGMIDLGLGDPQSNLLPLDMIRQAAENRLSPGSQEILQYGAEQGDESFRERLADFLQRGYRSPVHPGSLFITNGASMGLHLLCTLFTNPGDTVFVEEPTYFLALRIFADHGLILVPIHTDENGLLIESLKAELARVRPKFIYIIPTFQNPTGRTLPQDRRDQLVNLCAEHDLLLVADEVYHLLSYNLQPPLPFAAHVNDGNIVSLGSFSKILAPGLRLGWLQAGGKIIKRLVSAGLLDSGGGMNPFTSAIVGRLLETGGLEENIHKLVTTYQPRIAALDDILQRHLTGFTYTLPRGGYFFWIQLPPDLNAAHFREAARMHKVDFRPGNLFSSLGALQDHMRISFVFYDTPDLERGVLRLSESLKDF